MSQDLKRVAKLVVHSNDQNANKTSYTWSDVNGDLLTGDENAQATAAAAVADAIAKVYSLSTNTYQYTEYVQTANLDLIAEDA